MEKESILHDNAVRVEVKRSNFREALSCPGSLISQFIHLFTWLRHFITLFETGNMASDLIFFFNHPGDSWEPFST